MYGLLTLADVTGDEAGTIGSFLAKGVHPIAELLGCWPGVLFFWGGREAGGERGGAHGYSKQEDLKFMVEVIGAISVVSDVFAQFCVCVCVCFLVCFGGSFRLFQ